MSDNDLGGLYLIRKHGPDGAPPDPLVDPDPLVEMDAVQRQQERQRQQQLLQQQQQQQQETGAVERQAASQLAQTTGAVERQAANQAADPLAQAAQTGVRIPSMTPEGAPNLPTGIPDTTLINRAGQIVPPGFRGTEGRGFAPSVQESPDLGITTHGGLADLVEAIPDTGTPSPDIGLDLMGSGPIQANKPALLVIARSLDFIGSVLNVPIDIGATSLTRASQELYDDLSRAGLSPEQITEFQGNLKAGYELIGQLTAPGAAGGMELANPETVAAVARGLKGLATTLGEVGTRARKALPDVLQGAREALPALRESQAGIVKLGRDATELPPVMAEVKTKKAGQVDVPAPGPNPEVRDVAKTYMEENRIPIPTRANRYVEVKESRAKDIADAFDAMKHEPDNPKVVASYDALNRESVSQWDHAIEQGHMTFEPWKGEGQPYANSAEMRADVEQNHHLYFFQGGEFSTDHPMMQPSGRTATLADGTVVDLSYNDVFRAVHDYFGHAQYGYGFGPRGEENAWLTHAAMFSDQAIPAMTSETRGQNSYVNFGRHLRDESGRVPKEGEPGFVPLAERPFSEQKVGLLPEHFYANDFETRNQVLLPNVTRAVENFTKGEGRPGWYRGSPEELKKAFGRDDNLMAGFIAVLSQQKKPTPNTQLALQAYKLWKTEGVEGLQKMGVMGSQKRELIAMAKMFEKDPLANLEDVLSLTSLKRRDFYATFRGATDRPVIDRHIGAILYGSDFNPDNADQYRRASDLLKRLAKDAGVEPSQYQGAMWIAWREAKKLMEDNEPYMEILRRVIDQSPHNIRELLQPEYGRTTEIRRSLKDSVVKTGDQPKPVYHGTTQTYAEMDPAKADPRGLYGPGLYFTENPKVAGGTGDPSKTHGYAQQRLRPGPMPLENLADYFKPGEIVKSYGGWDRVIEFHPPDPKTGRWNVIVEAVDPKTGETIGPRRSHSTVPDAAQAPQVRPVYLDIKKPFDIDAELSPQEMERIGQIAVDQFGANETVKYLPEASWTVASNTPNTGNGFYRQLERAVGSRETANDVLKAAGYDGITHIGGAITGTDAHRVWIAFDKEQVVPTFASKAEAMGRMSEQGIGDLQVVNFLAQTLIGAMTGKATGDTPEERTRNALIGAGLGAVSGALTPTLVRRLTRGLKDLEAIQAPSKLEVASALMGDIAKEQRLRVVPATEAEQARYMLAGHAVPGGPGQMVQLNWASIRDPDGLEATVRELVTSRPPPQKTMTLDEIRDMSRTLGLTSQQVQETMATGGALAARMMAWKDLTKAAHAQLNTLMEVAEAIPKTDPRYAAAEQAFRQQYGTTAAFAGGLARESSELGRAMNVLRSIPQEMDVAGLASMAGKDISAVPTETLMAQVKSLPVEGRLSFFQQIGKHAADLGRLSLQTLNWSYMNARLATVEGGSANMMVNMMMLAESPLTRLMAAGGASVQSMILQAVGRTGRLDRVYWGDGVAQMLGIVQSVPEALSAAYDILKTGESTFGGIAKETPRFHLTGETLRPITARLGIDKPVEAAIRLAGTLAELPNRLLLMAPDEFAKVLNYRGETWAQAYNMVSTEFGGKWFAPIRDLARVPTGGADTATTAAERFLQITRNPESAVKQISTGKTESVSDIARDAANLRTFNNPLTGPARHIGEYLQESPLLRMTVVPFFRVPVNIFTAGLERMPVVGALLVDRAKADWFAGGARRDLLAARWALASGIMAYGAMRGLDGTLTGSGSRNPNVAELERMNGQMPNSLVLKDGTVLSINRFDVFGQLATMMADYVQLRPHMRDDEAEAVASGIVLTISQNMLSKTYMEGLANLMKLLMSRDPQHLEKNPILRNLVQSTVPSVVAQVERATDPAMRETQGMLDEIRARVPGLSSSLPAKLNWLTGEPQFAPQGWSPQWLPNYVSVFSPFKVTHLTKDPVVKELLHLQFSLGQPPEFLWGSNPESLAAPSPGQGVALTAQQHHDYVKLAATIKINGQTQYDMLKSFIATDGVRHAQYMRLTDGPDGSRVDQLHSIVMMYREQAQIALLRKPENAELAHRMIQKEDALLGAKTGQHLTPQQQERWFQGITR